MNWQTGTSIIAAGISFCALILSYRNSKKTIRLSIYQSILKSVTEKAKDCNHLWEQDSKPGFPNHKLVSELIISKELIDKSLLLFLGNDKHAVKYADEFYYLFAKQLRTDIRYFIRNASQKHADQGDVYLKQIEDLQACFGRYFN